MTPPEYIKNLILQGEGQQLDFKYHVADAAKIAKTLVAFANTDGGKLLVGVKDNGSIVGVASEEEVYMIELAAESFCNPPVSTQPKTISVDGKTVLEVYVPPSQEKPHYAKNSEGKWLAYIRRDDENLLANKVLIEVFKRKKEKKENLFRYREPEKILLDYLREHKLITQSQFCKQAAIPPFVAERVLISLISMGIVFCHITPDGNFYGLGRTQ
ncbi:MAG: ATP-binding protein [Bacteroidetes bacterium]|nr:ATP-binding protein [Bacteroidota bacterium]